MFCCGGGRKKDSPEEKPAPSSPESTNEPQNSLNPPGEATASPKIESPPPQQQQPPPDEQRVEKQEDKMDGKQEQEEKKEEKQEEPKREERKSPPSPLSARNARKQQQHQKKEEKAAAVLDMLFSANDRSQQSRWVQTADTSQNSNNAGSESENSDSESVKGLRKTPLAIMDVDLKQSGLRFPPMRFSPQEKILLRDNMSSVNKKDIQPKFNRLSHDHIKLGAYLGAAVRLVYKDHAYKIKRISYDRPLLHNGLLYFIDALERNGKGSFHIWLLIRLVVIQDDSAKIENPEPVMTINKKTRKEEPRPLCVVHDMYCKDCRHRKPCDHKFKACQRITDYTFGLYIKFPVKLEGNLYLYAITLNSPMQAALSSRVFLSSQAKKQAERARKEKEREEKGKEPGFDDSDGGGGSSDSSSAQSFSEVSTEHTGAVDLAQDYMDEDSFFERSYMSFRKAEPSQEGRRKGGMLGCTSDAGESNEEEYVDTTDDDTDDPDHEYDPPDDEEEMYDDEEDGGEGSSQSGAGAIGVLAQLRGAQG